MSRQFREYADFQPDAPDTEYVPTPEEWDAYYADMEERGNDIRISAEELADLANRCGEPDDCPF